MISTTYVVILIFAVSVFIFSFILPSHLSQDFKFFQSRDVRESRDGVLKTTLSVRTAMVTYETSQGEELKILMRSYGGTVPGPTFKVRRGDRLEIELVNELERQPEGNEIWNELSYPNRTILHTHGMHVTPQGHGDNMFVNVEPGTRRTYIYNIPAHHPSGIFWGHAHSHGSSMVQTAYGLAFPIIVLDDVDVPEMLRNVQDHTLVVQVVEYGTGSGRDIVTIDKKTKSTLPRIVKHASSKESFLVVNGVRDPVLKIESNVFYRFRLLHAGVDGWLNVVLEDEDGNNDSTCELWTLARDGHYLKNPRKIEEQYVLIPPGSRLDFLMRCENAASAPRLVSRNVRDVVNGLLGPNSMVWDGSLIRFKVTPSHYLSSSSSSSISNPNSLSILNTHPDLRFTKEKNIRRVRFTWTQSKGKDKAGYTLYGINGELYPVSQRPVLDVKLGQVQEWIFDSGGYNVPEAHPLHLHTNAFQIIHVIAPGCKNNQTCAQLDYKIGDWRDTITVPYQGSVTIRWRPVDFSGKSLAHCHILAHEDEGMMMAFNIVL